MSDNPLEMVREQFEYPMLDPLSVPVQVDEDTLHIRGGPFTGPTLTIEDEEREGQVARLVDVLDGETHVDDVLASFDEENREEIVGVLLELYEADAIRDAGQFEDWTVYDHEPINAEIELRADDSADARPSLEEQSLGIVNVGPIGEHVATTALGMGVGEVNFYQPVGDATTTVESDRFSAHDGPVEEAVERNDFVAYVADRRCSELEERINERAYETNTPWIVGQLLGYDAFVGPAIFPDLTPCFNCFKKRTASQAQYPEGFEAYWENTYSHPEHFPDRHYEPFGHTIAGLLGHDLGNLMEYGIGYLGGRVVWMNLLNLNMTADRILKLPRCEVCGVDPGGRYNPLMKRQDVLNVFDFEGR